MAPAEYFPLTKRCSVVILGGGFGGLYSALHLDKTIAADPTVEVTLVSRENFALFTPMLHEEGVERVPGWRREIPCDGP
jgi:NADH dehydrogenase FAD-containing subunit